MLDCSSVCICLGHVRFSLVHGSPSSTCIYQGENVTAIFVTTTVAHLGQLVVFFCHLHLLPSGRPWCHLQTGMHGSSRCLEDHWWTKQTVLDPIHYLAVYRSVLPHSWKSTHLPRLVVVDLTGMLLSIYGLCRWFRSSSVLLEGVNVASGTSPLYKIWKQWNYLPDFTISYGYEYSLAVNAVVLVIGGYQISIAKYLRGVSTSSIYPHIQFERDILNTFECSRRLGGTYSNTNRSLHSSQPKTSHP